MPSSPTATAFTTIIQTYTGIPYPISNNYSSMTTPYETVTFTITDPEYYNSLVGYSAVSVPPTTSSSSATASTMDTADNPDTSAHLSAGATAGVAIGCITVGVFFIVLAGWFWRRRKSASTRRGSVEGHSAEASSEEPVNDTFVKPKAELPCDIPKEKPTAHSSELSTDANRHELGSEHNRPSEGYAELAG